MATPVGSKKGRKDEFMFLHFLWWADKFLLNYTNLTHYQLAKSKKN